MERKQKDPTARVGRNVFITQEEAAALLGVTTRTVRTMIADGRLKGYRLGRRAVRLRLQEVEAAPVPYGGAAV